MALPYQYIAIEGNIGSGKTSLCGLLSKRLDFKEVLEQFTDNPFLPMFYQQPDRYAFPVELFFMTERHKQLQTEVIHRPLFEKGILADYFFPKTLLFARINLDESEYRLFQRIFELLYQQLPYPDLLIYLHRPVEECIRHIHRRNRSYEQQIEAAYLQKIQDQYLGLLKTDLRFPVLMLDASGADFVAQEQLVTYIEGLLEARYSPGVHRISLKEAPGR